QCASCSSCHHLSQALASELQIGARGRPHLFHDAVKQHHRRRADAEEHAVLLPLVRAANFVQPTSETIYQGLAHRPVPLDGQDVAADLLRDLLPQLAQPLAHGLMANVGAVERAAEPRTLGRATGHEPECTYLGTDVKGCRGPDPSPQCLHDRGGFLGSERTHAESLLPEKPPAVRNFAGKRVRRRGLVSLQSYTFKSCLPDRLSRRNCAEIPERESRSACALAILDHRWTTT